MDDQRPIAESQREPLSSSRGRLFLGGLALIAFGLWLWSARPEPKPERDDRENEPVPALLPDTKEKRAPAQPATLPPERTEPAAASSEPPAEDRDPFRVPHPITPEHLRLQRETELLHDSWKALEARDFAKARELIAAHRSEYPDVQPDMDQGLEILADCMEHPSSDIVGRARHFYDEFSFSKLRRRIRKFCLEPWDTR